MRLATTAFASCNVTNITMQQPNPGWVQPTMDVYNVTKSLHVGKVLTFTGTALVLAAGAENAAAAGDELMFDWYGGPRVVDSVVALDKVPSAYSLDNFGSILYAMTSADGRLLMWDPAVGGKAVVQPATSGRGPVPSGRCFVVTNERFIMVFGASDATNGGGPRRFAWCDQENPGAWDYTSVTSQAGYLDIEPASPIICASATRNGIIFFTAKESVQFRLQRNALHLQLHGTWQQLHSVVTRRSISNTSSMIVWMSKQGAWSFDFGASIVPANPASFVRPWSRRRHRPPASARASVACAVHVGDFSEVWWFFPAERRDQKHAVHLLFTVQGGLVGNGRARWAAPPGSPRRTPRTRSWPTTFVAFQHEVPCALIPPTCRCRGPETYDLNLNSGAFLTTVKQLIPDISGAVQTIPLLALLPDEPHGHGRP